MYYLVLSRMLIPPFLLSLYYRRYTASAESDLRHTQKELVAALLREDFAEFLRQLNLYAFLLQYLNRQACRAAPDALRPS